jgi:hypothetical protein
MILLAADFQMRLPWEGKTAGQARLLASLTLSPPNTWLPRRLRSNMRGKIEDR